MDPALEKNRIRSDLSKFISNFLAPSLFSSPLTLGLFDSLSLFQEAGCPDGVVNVIHGQHDCVNFICDHPDIRYGKYLISLHVLFVPYSCL